MSYLILHGLANHRPPAHWEFQLAAALAADGEAVAYPSLPKADAPQPEEWDAAIERALGELPGTPDVIAHSLGVEAWLRRGIATADGVGRVLLVAPPGAAELADIAPQFPPAAPFAAPAHWELWCSDADPFNAVGAQKTHAEPFGLACRVFPGAKHFTPASGYGVWPEVLDWARARKAPGAIARAATGYRPIS